MPRILHVGKYFPPFNGGIENFMADLLPATQALGCEVAAIVHQHDRGPGPVSADSPIWQVPTYGELLHAPVAPAFRGQLRRVLKEWRPDILHVHVPNTSAFWLLTLRGLGLPMVIHWHADVVGPGVETALKLAYPAYRPFEQALLRRAAAVIATSPGYLASSRALAPWHAKSRVIPLGMAASRVAVAGRPALPTGAWPSPSALRVLAVGRLAPYKGIRDLLQALVGAPQVELLVIGDGQQRAELERFAVELGVERRVCFAGRVDDATRNRCMAECDLLCLPSTDRGEAFGLVLLEAMAAGKPALVTEVPGTGMSWVVQDGQTGWHVPPGDPKTLAARLATIAQDRHAVQRFGMAGRRRFEEQFSIDAVAAATAALYREVLAKRAW